MFDGIFNLLSDIIRNLVVRTVSLISQVFTHGSWDGTLLGDYQFNFSLFSETPIFTTNLNDLLSMFFSVFYSMFFIVLLYKATKKFINIVFGVFRV